MKRDAPEKKTAFREAFSIYWSYKKKYGCDKHNPWAKKKYLERSSYHGYLV
jgi:hypothetical protein